MNAHMTIQDHLVAGKQSQVPICAFHSQYNNNNIAFFPKQVGVGLVMQFKFQTYA